MTQLQSRIVYRNCLNGSNAFSRHRNWCLIISLWGLDLQRNSVSCNTVIQQVKPWLKMYWICQFLNNLWSTKSMWHCRSISLIWVLMNRSLKASTSASGRLSSSMSFISSCQIMSVLLEGASANRVKISMDKEVSFSSIRFHWRWKMLELKTCRGIFLLWIWVDSRIVISLSCLSSSSYCRSRWKSFHRGKKSLGSRETRKSTRSLYKQLHELILKWALFFWPKSSLPPKFLIPITNHSPLIPPI
jgi:hypothetical protein